MMQNHLKIFPPAGLAVVIGAGGGIGRALLEALSQTPQFESVIGLSRSHYGLDMADQDLVSCTSCSKLRNAYSHCNYR